MSSEFQRIMGGASDPPPLRERGVPSCAWGADARLKRLRYPTRAMRNEMVASRGISGKVGEVLPGSPSALGCFRLFLLLVLSTSASLEETWIGWEHSFTAHEPDQERGGRMM